MANFYQSNGASTTSIAVADGTTQTAPSLSSVLTGLLFAAVGNTDSLSANSGTQNFATTYTIPANYLTANKILKVTLCFALTSSAATIPNISVNLLIGGVTVFTAQPSVAGASAAGFPIAITFYIQGSAAAGASAAVYTHPESQQGGNTPQTTPFKTSAATGVVAQPVNLPTNGAMVIQPQFVTSNSTVGNSLTLQQFLVEALN